MRQEQTPAEESMASILRDLGVMFLAQWPLEGESKGEIVDFLVYNDNLGPDLWIAIEVDGPEHKEGPDRRRDMRLWMEHSIKTVRYTNEEVLERYDATRAKVIEALNLN
jgi:very-short-patch-repair endonuclease